jgi:5'-nucleotidase
MRTALLLATLLVACKPPATPTDDLPVTVTILAMNDFHGALYEEPLPENPGTAIGGLPWVAGALEALRAEDPDLVLLDAGDIFQGSWPVNATQGRGSIEALNLIGVDAAAVGNHDFDYGGVEGGHSKRGALEAAGERAQFAWLAANIHQADEQRWQPPGFAPWTVIERKGKRLGVIGLSTTDTPQTTLLEHVDDLTFADPVQSVKALLPEIEAADVDALILLGHLTGKCEPKGYLELGEPCTPGEEVGRLLTELPEGTFAAMVLGHTHTLLAHRVGDTYLLSGRARGHVLGRLDLVIGRDGVDPEASNLHQPWALTHAPVDPGCDEGEYDLATRDLGGREVTPSAPALELVRQLETEAGSLCTAVGCTAAPLQRSRTEESEVGNLATDAMAWALPEADIAIQNSGGLRANLPQGVLRREHLQAVMPFDNRILTVEMTGAQVELMFRIGSSGAHGILQVSGARYHFDPDATGGTDVDADGAIATWERDRLCSVTVGDEPLDPGATYRVAITDFLFGGGDHLAPAFDGVTEVTEGPLLREVLFGYPATLEHCIGEHGPLVDPDAPRISIAPCETGPPSGGTGKAGSLPGGDPG